MKSSRSAFVGLAVLLMMIVRPPSLEAQTSGSSSTDTVQNTLLVTVRGDLAAVEMALAEIAVPEIRIGQSATIIARAVDSDGDPVPADFFWEVNAPEYVGLEVTSDSTAVITGLQKTPIDPETGDPVPVIITVTAVNPVEVHIAGFRVADGKLMGIDEIDLTCAGDSTGALAYPSFHPSIRDEAEAWCSVQACAYAIRNGRMVLQSAPPPECPLLWPPVEEPSRPLSDRIRPLAVLAQALR